MKLVLILALSLFLFKQGKSQALYNASGDAKMYFDESKNSFFSYSGEAIGYLKYNSNNPNILLMYSYKGNQLGWYQKGILYGMDGKIDSYTKDAGISSSILKIEPIRGIQQIIPIKGVEAIPAIQPIFSNTFSYTSIYSNNYSQVPNIYDSRPAFSSSGNDYSALAYKPYSLPVEAISNAFRALNKQHEEMTRRGYVLDNRTGEWMKREDYIKREEQIAASEKQIAAEVAEAWRKADAKAELFRYQADFLPEVSYKKLKAGWYYVHFYINRNHGVKQYPLYIRNNKIHKIMLPDGEGALVARKLENPIPIHGKYYTSGTFYFKKKLFSNTRYFVDRGPTFYYSLGYKKVKRNSILMTF